MPTIHDHAKPRRRGVLASFLLDRSVDFHGVRKAQSLVELSKNLEKLDLGGTAHGHVQRELALE